MRTITNLLFAVMVLFLLKDSHSYASNRVAFLVGNSAYEHSASLKNPERDVKLISETLSRLNFSVETHFDLSRNQIGRRLSKFLKTHKGADVTLFYFAGHGMQYENQNYLVGVDAKLETEFDIESEAVDLEKVVQLLKKSSKASLVFVDACRDNPLADQFYKSNFSETRAMRTRGLAPVKSAYNGAMITFSAAPGQVAYDGDRNSPFAASLAKHLPSENIEVLSLMKRVIRDVKEETGNKQIPLVSNDLTTEIYLKLGSDGAGSSIAFKQEEAMFNAAIAIQSPRAWDLYFKRFPNGFFKDLALVEHERLQVTTLASASGVNIEKLDTTKPIKITREVAKNAEQRLGLTKDDAKLVQQALNERGYNAGAVDGAIGNGTRKAIADFQAAVNLPSTGVVTKATATALGVKLEDVESSNVAVVSSNNARKYDPDQIALVEDDQRLIKAAKVLERYNYVYGFFDGRLYLGVQTWGHTGFEQTEALAKQAGGYLASVTSKAENDFIYNLVKHDSRFWSKCEPCRAYFGPTIGFYQPKGSVEPAGGYRWSTGEKVSFRNWQDGEPSNTNNREYMVAYHYTSWPTPLQGFKTSSKWGDMEQSTAAIVIEID